MPSSSRIPALVLLAALAAAGCERSATDARDGAGPPPAAPAGDAMQAPDAPPPFDGSDHDVPPATADQATSGRLPAPGTVTWTGFGAAEFGADQEAVRQSWGRDLGPAQPDEPGGCYYLIPKPHPETGFEVAFMIDGDRFSRMDVRTPEVEAPGGGRVGMPAAGIETLYPGQVEALPHKYVDGGRYLRIRAPDGGGTALLFETSPEGEVTEWRIGAPPQVDYVEGCS